MSSLTTKLRLLNLTPDPTSIAKQYIPMNLRDWFRHHPLWSTAIIYTILTLTVGNIYVKATNLFLMNQGLYDVNNTLVSIAIRFIVSSLTFTLLYRLLYKQPRTFNGYRRELMAVKGNSWRTTIVCGIASFIIFASISASILIILRIFTSDPLVFLKQPNSTRAGWLWPLIAINPGLFEEMGFRGLLSTNLRRIYSERTTVIVASILFGLFHFTGLVNGQSIISVIMTAIMATTFGLSWGYMAAKTGSVIPSMIVHYLVNAFSEVLMPYSNNDGLVLLYMLTSAILYPIISILVVRLLITRAFGRRSARKVV